MAIFIAICLFFIIYIIYSVVSAEDKANERKQEKAEFDEFVQTECQNQNYFLSVNNVIPDVDYGYVNYCDKIRARYVVDGKQKMIYFAFNNSEFIRIPFSDIVGFEIMSDSNSQTYTETKSNGGVGRAVAGYVLAGGVGAIVGAATAKKQEVSTTVTIVDSYWFVFYLTYISNPSMKFNLIQRQMGLGHPDYRNAVDFGNKVNTSMRSVIEISNRSRQLAYAMLSNSQIYAGNPGQLLPESNMPYNQQNQYPNMQGPFQQQNPWNNKY